MRITNSFRRALTNQFCRLHGSGVFRPGRQVALGAFARGIAFVLLASTAKPQNSGFKLVVRESNPTVSITQAEAARFFLKQTKAWPTGEAVIAVDQGEKSGARRAFSKGVLKKDVGAVRRYWQAQIFSGRGLPPPERRSDAAVLAFVQSTPGAIGYVSFETDVGKGVKEIKIRQADAVRERE